MSDKQPVTGKIDADSIVPQETFSRKVQHMTARAAIIISMTALAIGTLFVMVAVYVGDRELQAWATGLISIIAGVAVGFIFGERSSRGDD